MANQLRQNDHWSSGRCCAVSTRQCSRTGWHRTVHVWLDLSLRHAPIACRPESSRMCLKQQRRLTWRTSIVAPILLAVVVKPAAAIVTSDTPGSHLISPGQTAFGLNLDGVAIVGGTP